MNEAHFDAEVERTVRTMLDVSPAPDFRGRVLARLAERRPHKAWTRAAWGTAAAAVVLGAVLLRDAPAPAPGPAAVFRAVEKAAPPALPMAPATSDSGRAAVPARLVTVRRSPARVPSAPDDVPPIDVAEIAVAPPVALQEIEPPEIVIPPLAEPADVEVEPLSFPPGARD